MTKRNNTQALVYLEKNEEIIKRKCRKGYRKFKNWIANYKIFGVQGFGFPGYFAIFLKNLWA